MKSTTALKTGAQHGGPIVLGAGAAMFAFSLALPGPAPRASAEHQPPAVTIPPQTPAPVAKRPRPTPSPSSVRAAEPLLAAAPRTPVTPPDHRRPSAAGPSGPSPTPTSPPAAPDCHGAVVAVQVLRAACVSVGGTR